MILILLFLTIFLFADDVPISIPDEAIEHAIEATNNIKNESIGLGKSMDRDTAFRLACLDSVKNYVQNSIPRITFQKFEKEISQYLILNYKRYFVQKPTLIAWDGWEMKVHSLIKSELLLSEIEDKFNIESIKKKVAVIEWQESKLPLELQNSLKNIIQSQIEFALQKYEIYFTTWEDIQKQIEQEIRESGGLFSEEEMSYIEKTRCNFIIRLGLSLDSIHRTWRNTVYNYLNAKINVQIFSARDNTKLFTGIFPPSHTSYGTKMFTNEEEKNFICESLFSKVANYASIAVANFLKTFQHIPNNEYTIYFAGFSNDQKNQIIHALESMISKHKIYEFRKSIGGGGSLRVQLTTDQSIHILQDSIRTYCIDHGINAILDTTRQEDLGKHFFFVPQDEVN